MCFNGTGIFWGGETIRQGYILTNLINMSVKLFSTVSIVFFPVDIKSARYHSRFCIFNWLICIFPKWPPKKSNRL